MRGAATVEEAGNEGVGGAIVGDPLGRREEKGEAAAGLDKAAGGAEGGDDGGENGGARAVAVQAEAVEEAECGVDVCGGGCEDLVGPVGGVGCGVVDELF